MNDATERAAAGTKRGGKGEGYGGGGGVQVLGNTLGVTRKLHVMVKKEGSRILHSRYPYSLN